MVKYKATILFLVLILTRLAFGQSEGVDRVAVPFSDPSRPGFLEADLINGSITVTGYDGKEAVIEARTRSKKISRGHSERTPDGMIRLNITSTGLTVEEEHNKMSVGAASHFRTIDLDIKVPVKTSLNIRTINNGDIFIDNIEGEIEVNNVNGEIKVLNVSGNVLSNTTNGDVTVSFKEITPAKPMSFVSFNGDVDVTFPGQIKADVKIKTEHGDIFSDFDIKLEERAKMIKEDSRKEGGKFKLHIESAMYGKINGGGPEYHFSTFNGTIYIRKKK